jgi:hypothetical protein
MDTIWTIAGTALLAGLIFYELGFAQGLKEAGKNRRREHEEALANPRLALAEMYAFQMRWSAAAEAANKAWWSAPSSDLTGDRPRDKAAEAARLAFLRSAEAERISAEAFRRAELHWQDVVPISVEKSDEDQSAAIASEEGLSSSVSSSSIWSTSRTDVKQ